MAKKKMKLVVRLSKLFICITSGLIITATVLTMLYTSKVVRTSYLKVSGLYFDKKAESINGLIQRANMSIDLLTNSESDFIKLVGTPEKDYLSRLNRYHEIQNKIMSYMSVSLNGQMNKHNMILFVEPNISIYDVCPEYTASEEFYNLGSGIYQIEPIKKYKNYKKIMDAAGGSVWFGSKSGTLYCAKYVKKTIVRGATAEDIKIGILCYAIGNVDKYITTDTNPVFEGTSTEFESGGKVILSEQKANKNCYEYLYELDDGLNMKIMMPKKNISAMTSNYYLIIAVVVLMFLILVALIIISVSYSITKPIMKLSEHMSREGTLKTIDGVQIYDVEIENIYDSYNDMVRREIEMIHELEETAVTQKQMEVRLLQSRINPHFIYNVLDNINCRLLLIGEFEVARRISRLADYIRYNIKSIEKQPTLKMEIKMIEDYVAVFWLQYGERVQFTSLIEEEYLDYTVPKMIIQPLIENAVVHGVGVIGKKETLYIELNCEDIGENLLISIENNGEAKNIADMNRHIRGEIDISRNRGYGTRNVNERLKMIYGENYGLVYKITAEGKTRAEFVIPKIKDER